MIVRVYPGKTVVFIDNEREDGMGNLRMWGRKSQIAVAAAVMMAVMLATALPSYAGATWHNVPGIACGAFNNAQANALERNHVRLYNPPTNNASIWVLCPVQRVLEDLQASTSLPNGWISIYFNQSVSDVRCIVREYSWSTIAFPGTNDPVNQASITVPLLASPPSVTIANFIFSTDNLATLSYFTVACQLQPGTGINSINFRQQ
jgi:hypothetical protein